MKWKRDMLALFASMVTPLIIDGWISQDNMDKDPITNYNDICMIVCRLMGAANVSDE